MVNESNGENDEKVNENGSQEPSLSEQLDQQRKDFLYLKAEFENFKRNSIKERSDALKYGGERALVEILPVLDVLQQALTLKLTPENLDAFKNGVELTVTEFKKALERLGVEELSPEGKAFDPYLHEALSSQPTDLIPPGHVCTVFRKGYKLNGKVIRTAQVVVATAKAEGQTH